MQVTRKTLWSAALALVLVLAGAGGLLAKSVQRADDPSEEGTDPVKRGAYLFNAGNCMNCHTDVKNNGAPLAGGRPLEVPPFGTFYSPNISPDPEHGIGKWTDADFIQAFRHGLSPTGMKYYPVFPFASFTNMTDEDIKALRAYIMTLKPQKTPNKAHDVGFPFYRPALAVWRSLFFVPGPYLYERSMDEVWNRGAYLVTGVTHCGECHTPRNMLGGVDKRAALSGGQVGKKKAPDITSDPERGIGKWSLNDIVSFLNSGVTPEGDVVNEAMQEVVNETKKLTPADRMAIAIYLKSVQPVVKR